MTYDPRCIIQMRQYKQNLFYKLEGDKQNKRSNYTVNKDELANQTKLKMQKLYYFLLLLVRVLVPDNL